MVEDIFEQKSFVRCHKLLVNARTAASAAINVCKIAVPVAGSRYAKAGFVKNTKVTKININFLPF